jgi:hypothetical protein
MKQYHWADWTTGGRIAIGDVVGSTRKMRKFRPGAAPIVEFSTEFMPTRFEGRQRPDLVIRSWVTIPSEEPQPAALPAPATAAPPTIEVKPESITLDPVKPVTLSEELDDEIPI